jgi:hypothetical protein
MVAPKAAAAEVATVNQETVMKCVNAIRFLAIDGVNKAKSGHPGLPMGAAPMSYVLFNEFMNFNPKNPAWFNRDRFVLSAGHGSMLQYALMHLVGYDSVSVSDSGTVLGLGWLGCCCAGPACDRLSQAIRHRVHRAQLDLAGGLAAMLSDGLVARSSCRFCRCGALAHTVTVL